MVIKTHKMPCWYYDRRDLKNTCSVREGLDYDTERRYRKEGARFIMQCGTAMGLGHNTIATGVVYFHRFYMFHSFKSFPRYVTACCCLFLAGKVEETPKKCADIIKTARSLLSDPKFKSFGDDPKEEVMTMERILLQTIKFDLQIEHPYSFLVKYAKCLKGDKNKLQRMVQMAWNFVNDSLSTTVCLQWEPEIIAVALIHLASKLSKFTVEDWSGRQPNHLRWWDMFVANVTMEILEDICHQVLDLYQHGNQYNAPDSPPQLPPSKASPPVQKRLTTAHISASPYKNSENSVASSSIAPPQMPITTKITTSENASKQDNQPIPKLISSSDNMPYTYPAYAAMYAQPTMPYQSVPPGNAIPLAPVQHQHPPPPHLHQHPPHHPHPHPMYPPPQFAQPPFAANTLPQFPPVSGYYPQPAPPPRGTGYYPGQM